MLQKKSQVGSKSESSYDRPTMSHSKLNFNDHIGTSQRTQRPGKLIFFRFFFQPIYVFFSYIGSYSYNETMQRWHAHTTMKTW